MAIPRTVPGGGSAASLGASVVPEGVNFAVYSSTADAIWVCLFDVADREIGRFALDGRAGDVHFGLIAGIGAGARYGLRAEGRYDPDRALWFDPNKLLADPYAKQLDRPFVHDARLTLPRESAVDTAGLMPKAIVVEPTTKPLSPRRRAPGLVYELNVRGYTIQHPGVPANLRGTVAALTERAVLDHLTRLGVDTVELMPLAASVDERHLPPLGLSNAWGYNPVTYFAPDPRRLPGGMAELRAMTEVYRRAGIAVILDVVYNHTGESDRDGAVLSMRGLDARTYYRHVEHDGKLLLVNDTGTGNTLACDHPAVQQMVLDSLNHWVAEGGISGFRFDLAPVLGREPGFNPDARLLERIKADPVLGKSILIAEPWDPGPGGYQLGRFGREFREWNDSYRDDVRRFWRGDGGQIGALAGKLAGSSEIFDFGGRRPSHSVNFIAAHDGFTLADLVAYQHKHNEANGEANHDGHGQNLSWNNGVEGPTENAEVLARRRRDVRALLATLFVSRGTLMLGAGDELGRTQGGNNNAYCQDNTITWLDWDNADRGLIEFVVALNILRGAHPALTEDRFLTGQERGGTRDVRWLHPQGREMRVEDWENASAGVLGMHLNLAHDEVLVWFNRQGEPVVASLPEGSWKAEMVSDHRASVVPADGSAVLPARSVVVLARA